MTLKDIDLEKYPVGEGTPFFKAHALGDRKSATAKIVDVREEELSRTGDTILIDMEVDGIDEVQTLPLNKTNRTVLVEAFGSENVQKTWVDKTITVDVVRVNNPETKRMQDSIGLRVNE